MIEDKIKYVDAVTKLIKLTQENKIKWESGNKQKLMKEKPDIQIESVFVAEYNDKRLRLYQCSYEKPKDALLEAFGGISKEEWVIDTRLEIIDSYENSLWKFPSINALSDLFRSIQYQVAGVKTLIDDLLKE